MNSNCLSCGENLVGKYCHACGEKTVSDADFTLKKIIGDGINIFTNLDSKFFQSFYSLFLKPGKLTAEYLNGRRKPYMKPFQIFLISTIAFFLLLSGFDIFLVPSKWYFNENYDGAKVMDLVRAKMEEKSMTKEEIAILYDSAVAGYSKLFIVILLPMVAWMTYLFKKKMMPEFGKHFILATHNFSFIILWLVVSFFVSMLIPIDDARWFFIPFSFGTVLVYQAISFRKVWDDSWKESSFISFLIFFFLLVIVFAYRTAVSYFTLKWL